MIIASAEKKFRNGRFLKVIEILEPRIFEYRSNGDFYYYLGYSYLHTGDFIKANYYLKRALQLEPGDLRLLYGDAVLQLKKGETAGAIRTWLRIREMNPGDELAGAGLEFLRNMEKKNGEKEISSEECCRLVPGRDNRKRFRRKIVLFSALALVAAVIICMILI